MTVKSTVKDKLFYQENFGGGVCFKINTLKSFLCSNKENDIVDGVKEK